MEIKVSLIALLLIESFVQGQWNSGYQPRPRGGHFISNGQYHNQIPPQTNYNNQRGGNMYSVIGNAADNIQGSGAINSIVRSRFSDTAVNSIVGPGDSSGSSYNVIGNTASNVRGGLANSVFNDYPTIAGGNSPASNPFLQGYIQSILANTPQFGSFGRRK